MNLPIKKHIIYQITNEINGKIYIGKHSTYVMQDRYMGSGRTLRAAIKKYGTENFSKKILFVFDTEEESLSKEKELVSEEFINREDTYNRVAGGRGSWKYVHDRAAHKDRDYKILSEHGNKRLKVLRKDEVWSSNNAQKIKSGLALYKEQNGKHPGWHDRKHTEEALERIRNTCRIKALERNLKELKRHWIYSEIEQKSMLLPESELFPFLSNGWVLGRKMF